MRRKSEFATMPLFKYFKKFNMNFLNNKLPLSVFIITKNEADRIAEVINAVREIADEIIIVDSGSSDKTGEISEKMGAKFIFNQWQGYGPQKRFGESLCVNDWILNIDADEVVSASLKEEVIEIFEKKITEKFYAFRIKIVNKFRFEKEPKKLAFSYNQIRLYNKNFAGFKNSKIHDSVELSEDNQNKISQLKNIIYHQSFRCFDHWIEKLNSYSTMQAKEAFEKGKNVSKGKIFLTPFFAFFKAYFVRRYFIYGFDGFVYSYLFAFSRFAKMIKIREIFQEKK
jgi:glycosyltransferase involved in cell wall biosynthesis